ncbi:EAL domain-containing protein [Mesorhizobium sp. YIM 152430]|uniref:EAL domain-containing protein n=1 Tax=Mesorhizobium sp. YIM 152430 TaxID=3031761 RepID=UPI0023DA02DB|nr:EAL domain-containing protein [Mesorhizobium sp. YIM 152430]MDF1598545.1 EAL domain-containing protein [Mesorhizobium sp. YIM 152430]
MARSLGLPHIMREADGTAVGHWGPYVLKSAFQPIFTFEPAGLKQRAYEGLIRPFRDGEAASPGQFFAAIPTIDRLRVEALARDLHILNAGTAFGPEVTLFINFDPSLFCEKPVVDTALHEMRIVLGEAGIPFANVVCEVTEQPSGSAAALQDFVAALRGQGYRVAVDDYGADSSDMERVKQLRPDIVKFDAKWVARLMDSQPGVALLKVMVGEFRQRGIVTVFEGIEENWQLDVAHEVGAAMVQGFVLARPELAPTRFRPDLAVPPEPAGSQAPANPQTFAAAVEERPLAPRRAQARVFGRRGLT